ncbi:MAG: UvrD-helicase domain-containing protein, partial [Candidatus Omnitrophota bacterium]
TYGRIFGVYKGSGRDLIAKRKQIYNQIKEIAGMFPEGMNANAKKSINKFLSKNDHIFNIGSLPRALNSPSAPMNKGKAASFDFQNRWADTYKALVKLTELDATVVYNPYVELFGKLFDFFQAVSKKEDMLFVEELNRCARRLFDDAGLTVAELYYRLATRFRHFLIDEFQDTSCLQWQNLEMMVEEALGSGGSLFYVGDKKQAIYRFRGGEVKLFDDVKKRFSHFNVKHNYLTKNWRSQKAIVEFNNKVFSQENLGEALSSSGIADCLEAGSAAVNDIIDIFKDGTQQYREENASGYVQVKYINEKDQQDRDAIMQGEILCLIAELKKENRFQYGDLAILTRDNGEVEQVSGWLLEAGIPVESEKTLNVTQNPLIKEIIALLRFLYSPIDDLSFAAFILGRIFSQASGLTTGTITDFIFSLRMKGKLNKGISLYRLFREEFGSIWEQYFEVLLKTIGFISPYELLISIYQQFGLLNNFVDNQGFFMKLVQLVKAKEDDCTGLGEFLSYLETAPLDELYVNVTHSDSVKVLTIHKSKGLEFGVVILPFLRMDIKPETGGRGTSSYVIDDKGGQLGLVRITENHRLYSENLYQIYAENYKKACIDELNSIYVALTRPKYELYIFIPQKSSRSKNKVRYFIPEDIKVTGSRKKYRHKEKDPQPIIDVRPSLYKDWIARLSNEFADINCVKNREKISQGVVFHFMLSCIGNLHNQNKNDMVREAFKRTKVMYPSSVEAYSLEDKISSLLDDDNIRPLFCVKEGIIYREKEVVNASGNTRRLDRIIVKDKQVQIIDYKLTGDFKEKYQAQVKEYMSIIKDIYPQKCVEGFILYIEEAKIEEVKWKS